MIEDRTSHISSTGHLRDRCSPHCSEISDFICNSEIVIVQVKGIKYRCIEYNECHYGGMYNVYVKRIFVITEIVRMNAGVSSEKEKVKESQ